MDTTVLVQQAQDGDRQAMERLLTKWRPRLLHRALALVRSEATAQDVTQEVLIKVFRNLNNLEKPAAFASWVFVILQRVVIALYRRNAKERDNGVSLDETSLLARELDAFRTTHERLEMAQCMSQLKPEDKDLLEQFYWGGWELQELAPKLGIAPGAAKTRLFRARGRFGEVLCE